MSEASPQLRFLVGDSTMATRTGYGQAFCDAIRGDWGGIVIEDGCNEMLGLLGGSRL